MRPNQAQQQALLTLLNRIYEEIRAVEERYAILVRPDDFRPRIEYFHDVIREFTRNTATGFERTGRLSVESFARDVAMLRQIAEKPAIRHPELNIPLSPRTDIARPSPMPSPVNNRLDVSVTGMLGEGYGHYALLFVALLSYPAERNFMNRVNECTNAQEMMAEIADGLPRTRDTQIETEKTLAKITDPELRKRLMAALTSHRQKRVTAGDMLAALQTEKETIRKNRAALESSHLHFASSQLTLYQDAQTIVKKMAAQGLNIVGEFVESAVCEAQKGGRGF